MSLEVLIQTLTHQAEQTAAEERERTTREVERILGDAKRVRDECRESARASSEAAYRAEAIARRARVQRDARRRMLMARAKLLDRVFARVSAQLPTYIQKVVGIAPDLVREALPFLGDEPIEVMCPPVLSNVVKQVTADRHDAVVVTDASIGTGVLVRTANGSLIVNNTLEARFHRTRDELAIAVVRQFEDA
jgi:vacuolar-type H+-ATPase subunit E/Vma4